jgi:hypothetical protein
MVAMARILLPKDAWTTITTKQSQYGKHVYVIP